MKIVLPCSSLLVLTACQLVTPTVPDKEDQKSPEFAGIADASLTRPPDEILQNTLQALRQEIRVIQNNLANVGTPGFKKSRVALQDLPYRQAVIPGQRESVKIGSGVQVARVFRDHSLGVLKVTNRQLDLAIDGRGFFQVLSPDGSIGYTRGGSLHLDPKGRLVTMQGHVIFPEITLPPDLLDLGIHKDGKITGRTASSPDTTSEFGALQLVRFMSPESLVATGGGIYGRTEESGEPLRATPGEQGIGELQHGVLELSNVDPTAEWLELQTKLERYQAIQKTFSRR